MLLNLIIILVMAIIVTSFAVLNPSPITVNLFFWQFESSLALVIFISVLLGVIFAGLIGVIEQMRVRWKLYRAEAKVKEYEKRFPEVKVEEQPKIEGGEL